MRSLGLTATERAAFHDALRASHTRRTDLALTNLDGDPLGDLSGRLLDGQVVVDMDAEVTRTASLSLLDPDRTLNFDTDSPDDGAMFLDRMLRITYRVRIDGGWVDVPLFLGPVTKLDRAGDVVEVEAQGKEALAMGAAWRPFTVSKGTPKVIAIRRIMRERAGESRFSLPDLKAKLPESVSLGRYSVPWNAAQKIADGQDRQLFYPGDGRLELRRWPERPVWTFRDGDGGDVVSGLTVGHSQERVRNTVVVTGGKPKGRKDRVRAQAVAPAGHALSPQRLGRTNGQGEFVPRYLVERFEDDGIRSQSEARTKANRMLRDLLREETDVAFDALPIPHLDPGDLVRAEADGIAAEFRLRAFSIPLGSQGGVMSVGYLRKTKIRRGRIR